jgi:mono/diheme cytochrome c family protein/uncharacterized membrane protein
MTTLIDGSLVSTSFLLSSATSPWLEFGGRLHPLILHLPIGVLAALIALESLALIACRPLEPSTRRTLAALLAATALAAAGSGWLLAHEPSYGGKTLEWHRWLGIALAALASLTCLFSLFAKAHRYYALSLIAAALLMIPTGHLGGSMTHGENFLFEPFARAAPSPTSFAPSPGVNPTQTPLAASLASVQAIFDTHCVSCHGPSKRKGGLALHTPEALTIGGDSGPSMIPGDPASSELVRRLKLTDDDDERMPPLEKQPLTQADIDTIERWIAAGAPE